MLHQWQRTGLFNYPYYKRYNICGTLQHIQITLLSNHLNLIHVLDVISMMLGSCLGTPKHSAHGFPPLKCQKRDVSIATLSAKGLNIQRITFPYRKSLYFISSLKLFTSVQGTRFKGETRESYSVSFTAQTKYEYLQQFLLLATCFGFCKFIIRYN